MGGIGLAHKDACQPANKSTAAVATARANASASAMAGTLPSLTAAARAHSLAGDAAKPPVQTAAVSGGSTSCAYSDEYTGCKVTLVGVTLVGVFDSSLHGIAVKLLYKLGCGSFEVVYKGRVEAVSKQSPRISQPLTAGEKAAVAGVGADAAAPPGRSGNANSNINNSAAGPPQGLAAVAVSSSDCAAAGTSLAAEVAVELFFNERPRVSKQLLQELKSRELAAMQLLRGQPNVVQLLATGVLCGLGGCSTANPGGVAGANAYSNHNSSSSSSSSARQEPPGSMTAAVMELMAGSLETSLQTTGQVFPQGVVKDVVQMLLQPLELMHSGRLGKIILHIKTANVLLTLDGCGVKLADFGACALLEVPAGHAGSQQGGAVCEETAQPSVAAAGTVIGTPYYAAPEVGLHRSAATFVHEPYGLGVDMWSLGVVVVELLAGGWKNAKGLNVLGLGGEAACSVKEFYKGVESFVHGKLHVGDMTDDNLAEFAAVRHFVGCCCGINEQGRRYNAREMCLPESAPTWLG